MSSDSIFELIKTMTPAEKGYFKKQASFQSADDQHTYIKLFNIIDKQGKYDEGKILKRFEGHRLANNLSAAKNYLYKAILKSLRTYHANTSIDEQLYEMLRNIL